jgi:hypothetical protein
LFDTQRGGFGLVAIGLCQHVIAFPNMITINQEVVELAVKPPKKSSNFWRRGREREVEHHFQEI